MDEVKRLSRWATEDLVPDLTVLLDVAPEVGLARVHDAAGRARPGPARARVAGLPRAGPGRASARWPSPTRAATWCSMPAAGRTSWRATGQRAVAELLPAAGRPARPAPVAEPGTHDRTGRARDDGLRRADRAGRRGGRAVPGGGRGGRRRRRPAGPARRDDPRLAVHRPGRLGPLGGGPGAGRRGAVRQRDAGADRQRCRPGRRRTGLRALLVLPDGAGRQPSRRPARWCPRGCRSGSTRCARWSASAARRPVAAAAGRWWSSRTPTGSPRAPSNALLKAIEEPPDRTDLPALRAVHPPRRRDRDDPVALPGGRPADPAGRRDRPGAGGRRHRRRPPRDWAAQASQGHVGRARRLARDDEARQRRAAVLAIPAQLTSLNACFEAADHLVEAAEAEARALTDELDVDRDRGAARSRSVPAAPARARPTAARGSAGVLKDLEKRQKSRATRLQRDALDRALVDLASFYRDVLLVQAGVRVPPAHPGLRRRRARRWPARSTSPARCTGSMRCWPAARRSS